MFGTQDIEIMAQKKVDEIYEFEKIIGEGTFSAVVRALHNETKAYAAVKIIDKAKVVNDKQRWRLVNEVNIHKSCHHANIVELYETYETAEDLCMVMELCEGGELFDKIVEKGRFTEVEAANVMRQLVSSVDYLHLQDIVHRDIKPENILFAYANDISVVKLADFGLAKRITHEGRDFLLASQSGTTAYMSPERLEQGEESKKVDMWSLGCILYFMLVGRPPFYSPEDDDDEVYESVMNGPITFPDNVPISQGAKNLVLGLLEKDPSMRLGADQCLAHSWLVNTARTESQLQPMEIHKMELQEINLLKSSINRVIDSRQNEGYDDDNADMGDEYELV